MSIQTKTMASEASDTNENILEKAGINPALMAALHSEMQASLQVASGAILERTYRLADDMLSKFKTEMQGYAKPVTQILAVEVDNQVRKLKETASPALGRMIINAKLDQNTMLVGPTGCGKTVAARQLATALDLPFAHICCTGGMSETWLTGRQYADGTKEASFSKMYRNGGVFLIDEMDAAGENVLMLLNTALANGHFENPILGETIPRHKDFKVVACANTVGKGGDSTYTARNRLDGATLNRFILIPIDYDETIEKQICPDKALYKLLTNARKKLRDLKSDEVISTRSLDICYKQKCSGVSMKDILISLTLGWPDELIEQCKLTGVDAAVIEETKPSEAKPTEEVIEF